MNTDLIEESCSSLLAPHMKQVASSPPYPSHFLLPNTCNQNVLSPLNPDSLLTRGVLHLTKYRAPLSHDSDSNVSIKKC